MPQRRLRLALLSDLHAYQPPAGGAKTGPSYLPANPGVSDPDPFGDLHSLIEREKLNVELVLCGGDICDKADLRGFQYAWTQLSALKGKLGARELIATCGNHDLNSRLLEADEDPDPKGALQSVVPQFPFTDKNLTNHFWARNFAIVKPSVGVRVIVLNTSAYHGYKDNEQEHGRVSARTIAAIESSLRADGPAELNILLCHHHVKPLRGLWGKAPDHEFMQKGGELMDTLTRSTASPWLVLHGHRHVPNLEFSVDPACVVVGASSFSGQASGHLNQFHILDIEADQASASPLKGTIRTWSWDRTGGWSTRSVHDNNEGFPPDCGFGSAFQPRGIASQIEKAIGGNPDYVHWREMLQKVPDLKFITPAHFSQVEILLGEAGISITRERDGRVSQVGRAS